MQPAGASSGKVPGKRKRRGEFSASLLSRPSVNSTLPVVPLKVSGVQCEALVDTGCTRSIVHVSVCRQWAKGRVGVTTVSGQRHWCEGTGLVEVTLQSGHTVAVEVLVVAQKPLGFAFILGMNGVEAMDGVRSRHKVRFGVESAEQPAQATCAASAVSAGEADFTATYDPAKRKWSISWKWSGEKQPEQLSNTAEEYRIPSEARQEYEQALQR